MFLAIHIGVLMDQFGTRKVTLFYVWTGMALTPLFPLMPRFWPLLLLQLSRRHVPGDPYQRFDGPVRHAQSHVVLCVDGDGFDAPVSADAMVLALVAAATQSSPCSWRSISAF